MEQATLVAEEEPLLKRTAEPLIRPVSETKGLRTSARATAKRSVARSVAAVANVWSRLDFTMLQQEQGN